MRDIIGCVAFMGALGIVGTVENGGRLGLMWWTIPFLAVAWWCFRKSARESEQDT